MRRVGTVVRAGRARRWTRPLFLGIASLSLALVVAAGCTPVKPTPPIDTPDTAAPGAPSTPDLAASSDTGVSSTDNITNDTAPTFAGTAEAGSTVKLLEGDTEIGSGTATGGAYNVTTSALAEGDHTITATATDPANNTSPASSGLVVTIDVTAPAGPSTPVLDALSDSGTPADGITSDNTPTVTGTAVADATVTIHDGGTAVGSAPATGGNYSVVTSALPDGDRAISATASDVAGNPSAASAPLVITIDTSAPVVSITTPANGAVTNDNTPALSGVAENAQVTVSIYAGPTPSGTPVQTLTPLATSGAWAQDAGALADGVYTAQATQGDTAGNVGTSPANTFTVDTVAPLAPSTPDLDAASDTGTSNTDDVTSDTTPTFTGTAEADSLVRILADGIEVGSGTATGGNYNITTSTLTDDIYTITATATDGADNPSAASAGLQVMIDSTLPAAPSTPDLDAGSDTGTSSADENTSDTTPTFTGTAENGSTVRIFAGLTEVGSGIATGGNYSITTSVLADGVHSITATATDVAGTSPASGALAVTIDTTDPTVAVVAPADDAVTNDDTPEVSGTAGLDSTVTVEIYAGVDTLGTLVETLTPTAAGGLWSGTATTLADAEYTVVATQTDAAGNTGTSAANTFTVDTTAPAAPSTPNLDAGSDTGTSDTDNITNDNTPTFTGTAVEGSLVRILADGVEVGSGTANGGASYSITTSVLTDDVYDITATATDAANNTSGPSGLLEVTIDSNVPAAPSTPDLLTGSDTGASDTDDITSDDTPTFTGTAEPGSTVRILEGLTEVGSGTATGGTYSITTSGLSDDVHSITATATDVAGTSPPSGALSVTIDTTDPTVAVVAPADGAVTNDNTPELSGTASDAAVVTVTVYPGSDTSGSPVETLTPTAAGGLWSAVASLLADGTYAVEATQTDAAGNAGTSTANTFTVDTTAPAAPSTPDLETGSDTGTSSSDEITSESMPTFTGTAEVGSLVRILADGAEVGSGTAVGGNYSITTSALIDGEYAITATATDVAGTSPASGALSVTVDTTDPSVAVVAPANGAVTNDDTPSVSGTATLDSTVTVEIYAGSDTSGALVETLTPTATGGLWSDTATTLANGEYTVEATQTDAAGNTGTSTANTFTVDTTAPGAPSTPDLDAASDTGTSSTDDVTSDTTPTFTGTAEAGSLVRILADGVEVGSGTATGGNYSITTSALTDDEYDFTATATDAASNTSAPSGDLEVTIDTTVPAAPSTPDLDNGSDSGVSDTDDITSDDTPTFTGTAAPGSLVRISANGVEVGSGTATGGNYSITTSTLTNSDFAITATATDVVGTSPPSDALLVTIDTTEPAVTVISPADNSSTSDDTPLLEGTADDGLVTVTIYEGPDTTGTVNQTRTPTAASGLWSDTATMLPDGEYTVEATQTDLAGNTGTSTASTFTVNPALAPGISGTVTNPGGSPVENLQVLIVTVTGALVQMTFTDASGNYSVALADGDYKVAFFFGADCVIYFDDQTSLAEADVVSVTGAPVTDVDAESSCATISGQVTNASGDLLANVAVGVFDSDENLLAFQTTNPLGNYELSVFAGARKVAFQDLSATYASEWYDDAPSFEDALVLDLAPGDSETADAVLSPGSGTITGNVTGDSAIALPGVQVAVLSPYNEFPIASTTTDADGDYTVAVSASDYKVRFSIAGCNEYYDDEPDFASADVVTVAPDDDVTANEELDCSTISGTITDAGGALRGVPIQIFEAGSSSQVATATTDSSGHYDALVGDGDYKIVFGFPDPDQCGEFYADKTDLASADVVTVTGVDVVANAELTNCATISGTVTSAGGAPVAGLFMPLRDAAGNVAGATATDASGHYTHLVTPGDYKVEFGFSHPCGEFYDNKATEASADVVSIANGGRVTADAQLSCLIISGTVTGPTGDPLSPVGVHIYTAADTPVASMVTDASGDYSRLVAPGDYKIQFDLGGGCGEWYEDKPDQASADVVSANATDVTANAALPCDEPLQGEISGTITNCSPCTLAIELYTTSGTLFAQTNPDEDGHYSFQVQPGDYKIRFAQFGACGPCAEEWYDDKPDLASADVVHVTDGGTVTADAEIEFEGGI